MRSATFFILLCRNPLSLRQVDECRSPPRADGGRESYERHSKVTADKEEIKIVEKFKF